MKKPSQTRIKFRESSGMANFDGYETPDDDSMSCSSRAKLWKKGKTTDSSKKAWMRRLSRKTGKSEIFE